MYLLKRKIHPTWQLTVACAGIVIGTTLAQVWAGFTGWPWLMLGVVLCAVAAWKSRRILCFAALVGGMLIGLYRGGVDQTHLAAYESYIGQAVMLSGVIDEDPSVAGSGTHALQLVQIQVDGRERIGTVYVTVETDEMTMRRSDRVTMRGQLIAGFGNFAASMYRAEVVSATRPVPGDVALEARDSFAAKVRGGVDEPAASLGVGFLLGQKSALPSTLVDALQVAGLTHIVVASGYNLMVLVRLSRRALEKHSRYLATLASAGLIVGFIAMTGMTSSMTRAGLVAALGLAAWYVGRRFHPVTLLVFAAAVTVLAQPSNVWGNVGWMLSFAAFAGVMIVAPLFTAYFFGKEKVPFVPQLFIETSSAQLATLPIIVATFGNVSVVALLANLLILPLIPFTMLLTFLTGVVGFIAPVLQPLVAWPTQLVLDVIVHIVEWCASLPGAQIEWQASVWVAAGMYVILILGCAYVKWRTGYRLGSASVVD